MLDFFSGLVGYDGSSLKLGKTVTIDPDGEIIRQREKWETVEGSYTTNMMVTRGVSTKAMVKAAEKMDLIVHDDVMRIQGNPTKFIQGHNVFGPSVEDLGPMVREAIRSFPEGLRPLDADSDKWAALQRNRADITVMVNMGSHSDVHDWIRAAATSTRSRHGRPLVSGMTVYWGKNSTRWTMKAYCKACELKVRPARGDKVFTEMLSDYVQGQLRLELTLRRPEIRNKGTLNELMIWDYFERISVGVMSKEKLAVERPDLSSSMEACLTLWLNGVDVSHRYPRRTFYRMRKGLKEKTGVDISLDPVDQESAVKKVKLDIPYLKKNEIIEVPEYLQGFLFRPDKGPLWEAR